MQPSAVLLFHLLDRKNFATQSCELREFLLDFQKTFLDHYLFQSIAGSPDDLMNFIKSEEPKWRKVIQDAKIKVE